MPSNTDNNISPPNDLDQFYEAPVVAYVNDTSTTTNTVEEDVRPTTRPISVWEDHTEVRNRSIRDNIRQQQQSLYDSNIITEITIPTATESYMSLHRGDTGAGVNTTSAAPAIPIASSTSGPTYFDRQTRDKLETAIGGLFHISLEFITLAGGAPRDYYMNSMGWTDAKPVKDYDIFVFDSDDGFSVEDLYTAGFENVSSLGAEDYDNSGNEDNVIIDSVYRCYYEGLELNVIITNQVTSEDIINNFGCSLSKFELDVETGQSKATKEARLSLMSRSLIFKPETSDNYKRKIKAYFPSFTERSYEQAAMYIIDKQIRSLPNET